MSGELLTSTEKSVSDFVEQVAIIFLLLNVESLSSDVLEKILKIVYECASTSV